MAKREPMSSVDRSWLLMDSPTNRMIINGFWVTEEPLDYDQVLKVMEERLLIYDRFRQRVVESRGPVSTRFYWEIDPHFDLRSHLRRMALPAPGDQRTLQEVIAQLLIDPLDRHRPLWEFYLIEGYGGGSVFFGRIHHCIGDGIALVNVLLSLTDATPNAVWTPPETGKRRRGWNPLGPLTRTATRLAGAAVDLGGLVLSEGKKTISHPAHLIALADKGGKMAGKTAAVLAKLALMLPDDRTVFKGELGVSKAIAWSGAIPLDDVKTVKNVMGATVNDVLVAAVAGALRRYMLERGDAPDGKEVRAMVPVNIRPPQDAKLTNRFALVYLSLPVGVADPLDRLFETKRRMDAIKHSPEAPITYQILSSLGLAPGEVAGAFTKYFASKASAVLTNVPGPPQKLYFAGRRFDTMVFWVPQSGSIGMGISLFSYGGDVTLGLITDRNLVPDPDRIIAGFHAAFGELLRLARLPEAETMRQAHAGAVASPQEAQTIDIRVEETGRDPEVVAAALLAEFDALKEETGDAESERCHATTKAGTRCRNRARPGSLYCAIHPPEGPSTRREVSR